MVEAQLLTNEDVGFNPEEPVSLDFCSLKPVVLSFHQTHWLETISIVYIILQFLLSGTMPIYFHGKIAKKKN